MSVSIRKAADSDLVMLAKMNANLVADQGSPASLSLTEFEQRFAGWLNGQDWNIDVLCDGDNVIGYAVHQVRSDYYYPDERVAFIRQFYIERGCRQRGLGSQAFAELLHARFPNGYAVELDVVSGNSIGQAFWSKLGFEPYAVVMKRPGV